MQGVRKQIVFVPADKYVLAEDYDDIAPFRPSINIETSYGFFSTTGAYRIRRGFLFSANWPAINTFNTRRGAAVHDFFYSLMKDGFIDFSFRDHADYLLYDMLREDGMPDFRAYYWLKAVQIGGEAALRSPRPPKQYSPVDVRLQDPVMFGRAGTATL
jgi:hypothetical protein